MEIAIAAYNKAVPIFRKLSRINYSITLENLAVAYEKMADLKSNTHYYIKAIKSFGKVSEILNEREFPRRHVGVHTKIGDIYEWMAEKSNDKLSYDKARTELRDALLIVKKYHFSSDLEVLELRLARLSYNKAILTESGTDLRTAIKQMPRVMKTKQLTAIFGYYIGRCYSKLASKQMNDIIGRGQEHFMKRC